MTGLPGMVNKDGIRKWHDVSFRGYNHQLGALDGELWDMENLTSDYAPLLAPRRPRYKIAALAKPNGFYARCVSSPPVGEEDTAGKNALAGLYWADGTDFYAGGVRKGDVADGRKRFASLGDYIIILPDKAYYNTRDGVFGDLEASVTARCSIRDGSYAEEDAEANTIWSEGMDWAAFFKVGDAVTVSGTDYAESPVIIREIEGNELRFYENTFSEKKSGEMTVARTVPDMDFICENENRLWGCKGGTIYASKLGDPFNWNVFDGLSTDSYAVDVGSGGDFTGCCSFLGYPCFFKEDHIYKVYGEKVSAFQVMGSADLGVERGSGGSLGIAGEILFYLSRAGVAAYSGGIPQSIAAPFGIERYRDAVGGSDGIKYYVSMRRCSPSLAGDGGGREDSGTWSLFVFDTRTSLWHREDGREIVGFGWNGELYFLDADGTLWLNGNTRTVPEGAESEGVVESMAEFGDFTDYAGAYPERGANRKGTGKLQVRLELEAGASVTLSMLFDSGGGYETPPSGKTDGWMTVATLTNSARIKRSYYLPIIPRRSDHYRIRITGSGDWKLYSLAREEYSGSEL